MCRLQQFRTSGIRYALLFLFAPSNRSYFKFGEQNWLALGSLSNFIILFLFYAFDFVSVFF